MNKMEITKQIKIIIMRNGIEIRLEGDKLRAFENALSKNEGSQFIRLEGRIINTADLSGIFYPEDLEELYERKRGNWDSKRDAIIPEYAYNLTKK